MAGYYACGAFIFWKKYQFVICWINPELRLMWNLLKITWYLTVKLVHLFVIAERKVNCEQIIYEDAASS